MKFLIPLVVLLTLVACKKKNNESAHEPVAGLQEITTLNQIESEIGQGVSLVFFHASWCSACQAQRPAVSEVALDDDLSTVFFGEVEFEDYPDIVDAYNVTGFPTIVIFKDGAEVQRYSGAGNSAEDLKQEILSHL